MGELQQLHAQPHFACLLLIDRCFYSKHRQAPVLQKSQGRCASLDCTRPLMLLPALHAVLDKANLQCNYIPLGTQVKDLMHLVQVTHGTFNVMILSPFCIRSLGAYASRSWKLAQQQDGLTTRQTRKTLQIDGPHISSGPETLNLKRCSPTDGGHPSKASKIFPQARNKQSRLRDRHQRSGGR